MRFVPVDAPPITHVPGDELKPVAGIRPVRPVGARGSTAGDAVQQPSHQAAASAEQEEPGRRATLGPDRRIVARRINHVPVLLEQRSGIDRRRHHLREGDIVEHIDVKV